MPRQGSEGRGETQDFSERGVPPKNGKSFAKRWETWKVWGFSVEKQLRNFVQDFFKKNHS